VACSTPIKRRRAGFRKTGLKQIDPAWTWCPGWDQGMVDIPIYFCTLDCQTPN
jgi:hypothetical protein